MVIIIMMMIIIFFLFFQYRSEGKNEILQLYTSQKNIVEILNENVTLSKGDRKILHIKGENSGHVIILGNLTKRPDVNTEEAIVRASVGKSSVWIILSDITGWLYFAAWSFSFYPQIYENWRRKRCVCVRERESIIW